MEIKAMIKVLVLSSFKLKIRRSEMETLSQQQQSSKFPPHHTDLDPVGK